MLRTHRRFLTLLSLLILAAISASAAFVQSAAGSVDLTTFSTLVNLDTPAQPPPFGTTISSTTPIEVYNSGGQTVNFSVPNQPSTNEAINFGITFDLTGGSQTISPYILSQGDNTAYSANTIGQMRFTLGNAVAAIGIHISSVASASAFSSLILSPVEIIVFFSDSTTATTTITATAASGLNPEQGTFHGYTSTSNNIVGFQVRGGPIALDNLRFGSLDDGGGDPGDPGDPAAIPEASTFLLCGSALGLLGLLRRRAARN